jgi:hypothetical protein
MKKTNASKTVKEIYKIIGFVLKYFIVDVRVFRDEISELIGVMCL